MISNRNPIGFNINGVNADVIIKIRDTWLTDHEKGI